MPTEQKSAASPKKDHSTPTRFSDWVEALARFEVHFGRFLWDILGVFLIAFALMTLLGIFTFLAKMLGFDVAPFVLGFILEPILETAFQRSLMIAHGDFSIFVSRPIAVTLLVLAFLIWMAPLFSIYRRRRRGMESGKV